jgi:hypothetical protein
MITMDHLQEEIQEVVEDLDLEVVLEVEIQEVVIETEVLELVIETQEVEIEIELLEVIEDHLIDHQVIEDLLETDHQVTEDQDHRVIENHQVTEDQDHQEIDLQVTEVEKEINSLFLSNSFS